VANNHHNTKPRSNRNSKTRGSTSNHRKTAEDNGRTKHSHKGRGRDFIIKWVMADLPMTMFHFN
jgi:hypothetical protein